MHRASAIPMHDALRCEYADDVGTRRRSHYRRKAIGSTTGRNDRATHLGTRPAIARHQSTPEGAQRSFAFRAEGRRRETRSADRQPIAGRRMSIALLDLNVLVALFDPAHTNHEDAHRWFGRNRKYGWATCPITINGCIRVLSNPAYPTVEATPAEVAGRLRSLCSTADHHFWADSVSLMDEALFR